MENSLWECRSEKKTITSQTTDACGATIVIFSGELNAITSAIRLNLFSAVLGEVLRVGLVMFSLILRLMVLY